MAYKRIEIKNQFADWFEDAYHQHGKDFADYINKLIDDGELHHEVYNTDYFIIGTHQAKQFMGDKAFDIIGIVKDYEQDNFGEVTTDLSCPEKVVNMYAYIVGEEIISDFIHNEWDGLEYYEETEKRQQVRAIINAHQGGK